MLKKSLLTAALALLALGARPAAAAPVFLEPYGDIFAARTYLSTPEDLRPKDALQGQETRTPDAEERFLVSTFFRSYGTPLAGPDGEVLVFGGGFAYANTNSIGHPWSLNINFFNNNVQAGPAFEQDFFGFNIVGKFVLWEPARQSLPVIAFVGRYQDLGDLGQRHDLLFAVDQKINRKLYVTANAGYAGGDYIGGEETFVGGIGATWTPMPRLSFSANYLFDNAMDAEDFWSLSGTYAFDRTSSLRIGGGKHGTFFANYIAKFDW